MIDFPDLLNFCNAVFFYIADLYISLDNTQIVFRATVRNCDTIVVNQSNTMSCIYMQLS